MIYLNDAQNTQLKSSNGDAKKQHLTVEEVLMLEAT